MINKNNYQENVTTECLSSNIVSNKLVSIVGVHNIYTYLTYIHSIKYNMILYMILNKQYTYRNELKKLFNADWDHYLKKLVKAGVLSRYSPSGIEDSFQAHSFGCGRHQADKTIYYTITDEAKTFFSDPNIYKLISHRLDNKIKEFCSTYQMKLKYHSTRKFDKF